MSTRVGCSRVIVGEPEGYDNRLPPKEWPEVAGLEMEKATAAL